MFLNCPESDIGKLCTWRIMWVDLIDLLFTSHIRLGIHFLRFL